MSEINDNIAQGSLVPAIDGGRADIPMESADPGRRVVTVQIAAQDIECSFWVGLFKQGALEPRELYDSLHIEDIFHRAASQGIQEEKHPLMLSDTSVKPPRFIYLVPTSGPDSVLNNENLDDLVNTMTAWNPGRAGIYLAPELCKSVNCQDLLLDILARFIQSSQVFEFFLLPGQYGVNALLNTALKLKFDLEDENLEIRVFH